MAPTEPGTAHGHFSFGIFQNHGRIIGTDLATEEAVYAALVALMICPIGQLAGRRLMAKGDRAFPGQKAEQNPNRGIALGQFGTSPRRVDRGLAPRTTDHCAGFCHCVEEFAGQTATFQVENE